MRSIQPKAKKFRVRKFLGKPVTRPCFDKPARFKTGLILETC